MLPVLIYLLVTLIVLGLAWWVLSLIPLPPPIGQVIQVVFVVICVLVVVFFLFGLVGAAPPLVWR